MDPSHSRQTFTTKMRIDPTELRMIRSLWLYHRW